MSRIRSTGTKPEVRFGAALKKYRFKFEQNLATLPGKPDFVFERYKVLVFVHGCFWHGHVCQKGRVPKTNSDFWSTKITRNRARDSRIVRRLRGDGWSVLTVWECQVNCPDSCEGEALRVVTRLRRQGR